METAHSSEMPKIYQTTWLLIPEDGNLHNPLKYSVNHSPQVATAPKMHAIVTPINEPR
jgi:hypothetical protein